MQIQQAPREIKVKTVRFSLRRGKLLFSFKSGREQGNITGLYLKQRNAVTECKYPFVLKKREKGNTVVCDASLDANLLSLEVAFWDIVAQVETPEEEFEAVIGGQSSLRKLWLILFPRWTRTEDGHMIYPFVNGARQFTIQYRRWDKRYDSYGFIAKEYLALLCYFLLKPYWDGKKLWLVCEKFCSMAQDNAYYFFKYCMEELPQKERKHILYVMDKGARDYAALKPYEDNVIDFMSFKYMIYLCAAQYLISTDAIRHFYIWDSPNSVYKVLYQARKHIIFLQHGVMGFKQCHRTFHKQGGNRMALFVTSSGYEKEIIRKYFEYDEDEIIVTGLPRWDVLRDTSSEHGKEILLMPTWRIWLEDASDEAFVRSDYYKNYKAFLTDERLHALLKEHGLVLNFYLHPKFRDYMHDFSVDAEEIRLISFGEMPLNSLLMSCRMLITDYSSVAWDVYYQEKPVLFYPFDYDVYEKQQGSYMDLRTEAFGSVVMSVNELLAGIESCVYNDFKENEDAAERREWLLPLRDHDNSKRVYEAIRDAKFDSKLMNRFRKERTKSKNELQL